MADSRHWPPAVHKTPHTIPKDAAVLAAPRPEPTREAEKVGCLQDLAIVPPGLPVSTRSGFLLQRGVSHPQHFDVVDVLQEPSEPQLPTRLCCLTYALERTRRVNPARCPARVLLRLVPFGQPLSLHPLRSRCSGVVRGLPRSVHHRRASLDFPTPPRATVAQGEPGIFRFPLEVSGYGHGVSERAGLTRTSRYRCTQWGLRRAPSASRRIALTRLTSWPKVPLSTLRRHLREWLRMTRGRCRSLLHRHATFVFTNASPV